PVQRALGRGDRAGQADRSPAGMHVGQVAPDERDAPAIVLRAELDARVELDPAVLYAPDRAVSVGDEVLRAELRVAPRDQLERAEIRLVLEADVAAPLRREHQRQTGDVVLLKAVGIGRIALVDS